MVPGGWVGHLIREMVARQEDRKVALDPGVWVSCIPRMMVARLEDRKIALVPDG